MRFTPYYKRLDYLRSTGTQYIDLGIYIDSTYDVEVEFTEAVTNPDPGTSKAFFGTMIDDHDYWAYITGSGAIHAGYGSTISSASRASATKVAIKSGAFYVNDVLVQNIGGSFTAAAYTALLLAMRRNNGGAGNRLLAKPKRCRVWHNGTVTFDLIPVLWTANRPYVDGNTGLEVTPTADKPGMLNKVTGRLFVNQGTGTDFLYA